MCLLQCANKIYFLKLQVVGKAAKPIPVMILGVLVGHKSYPLKKYLFVLLIVIGVVMFMYKDQGNKKVEESQGVGIGELLLCLSLLMDGLTGAVQVIPTSLSLLNYLHNQHSTILTHCVPLDKTKSWVYLNR